MKTSHQPLQVVFPSAGGFTLIELLLAISLMATILAAMSSVLFIVFRLNNGVTESIQERAPVEAALTGIQHDLANIICNTNSMTNTGANMLIGPFQSINQTNTLPGQVGPDFYTTGGEPDGMVPWGDIEKVDYLLAASTNRLHPGQDLIRAVTRNLLPVTSPTQPDEKRAVLSGVQSVIFSYYDGTQWQPQWDSTQQTNLPVGLKMQIQMASLGNGRGPGKTYELIIPIDVQLTTNLTTALP